MSEMSFWDYLTIVVALLIIVAYIVVRLRRTLNNKGCSCALKPSGCSTESAERCSGSTISTAATKDIAIHKRGESD